MAALYRAMGKTVAAAGPRAKLYLAGAELSRCEPVEWMMRPALPRRTRFAEAMLHLGLNPQLWKDQGNIVLPRPQRIAPLAPLSQRAVSVEIEASMETTEFFAESGEASGLFYHEVQPLRLEAFDEVSPFGPENTYTWLAPQLSWHGPENRRRFAHLLAQSDVRTLLEGGWMLPLGQEASLQSLFDVYRRLPDVPFDNVTPTTAAQAVVVRQAVHQGRRWVYLVNDSPWPASVELELEAPADCTLSPLNEPANAALERYADRTWWKVELAPFDLAGAVLSSPEAKVADYLATLPSPTLDELRRRIRDIGVRQFQLREPHVFEVLSNPGFEKPAADGQIPGWEHRGEFQSVTLDQTRPYEGKASLRLKSPSPDAVTWIRSETIPAPASGRLTLSVWARVANANEQPELRLCAQWGAGEYRPAFFGRGTQYPLTAEWREYVFAVPLPPAEVRQLRVGVDLYGPGEVWIDGLRLYDARFERDEKVELNKLFAGADHDLSQGRLADCLQFLESYWPQFLYQYVEPPPAHTAAETPATGPAPAADKPKMLDRLRRWSPRRLLPF
jgi:hypothetical protein